MAELVRDVYDAGFYAGSSSGEHDPTNLNEDALNSSYVVRGGGYDNPTLALRAAVRRNKIRAQTYTNVGLRCARAP